MPPRRVKQEENDDFVFPESQGSGDGEETALEKALFMHYAAAKEKKRQEKERKFGEQATIMLRKDLVRIVEEMQTASESMEIIYTDFVNEYAATEDKIHSLWSAILKEHQTLAALIQKRYDEGIAMGKDAEKQHIAGLSKLRAACEECEQVIHKMVPKSDGDEVMEDVEGAR